MREYWKNMINDIAWISQAHTYCCLELEAVGSDRCFPRPGFPICCWGLASWHVHLHLRGPPRQLKIMKTNKNK